MPSGGESTDRPAAITRRGVLRLVGGGALAACAARVGYEVTGYGTVSGTNLPEQDLAPLARRRLRPTPFAHSYAGTRITFDGDRLTLAAAETDASTTIPIHAASPKDAASAGAEYGLADPVRALARDLVAIRTGAFAFEFSGTTAFFDRLREGATRPLTVAALRGDNYRRPATETVRRFADGDPARTETLVAGLAAGFREHAYFDVPRYVLGSVADHVLLNSVPLREHVAEPTDLAALLEGTTGLYCWEYTLRSIEAFHALPPHEQHPPVFGAIVLDERHNHMYTGLASAIRTDDGLRIPMRFLDYDHSTMYDTYRLRWLLGDGVDAYDAQHRASAIHYSY